MYEKEMINVLNARIKELEKKNAELEEKHWNECGQIARYDDDLRILKDEYMKLNLENSELRSYISTRFNSPKGFGWSTRKPNNK